MNGHLHDHSIGSFSDICQVCISGAYFECLSPYHFYIGVDTWSTCGLRHFHVSCETTTRHENHAQTDKRKTSRRGKRGEHRMLLGAARVDQFSYGVIMSKYRGCTLKTQLFISSLPISSGFDNIYSNLWVYEIL